MAAQLGCRGRARSSACTRCIRRTARRRRALAGRRARAPTAWPRARPGLRSAITTADCGPVLFADPAGRRHRGAHAGWRGALDGVLEATLRGDGAPRRAARAIVAVLGPTISQRAYEVGPEFVARSGPPDAAYARFFRRRARAAMHLRPARLHRRAPARGRRRRSRRSGLCTYSDEDALLQLPPRHPSRRDRLRPADLGDRPHALSAIAPTSPELAPKLPPRTSREWAPNGTGSGEGFARPPRLPAGIRHDRWCRHHQERAT